MRMKALVATLLSVASVAVVVGQQKQQQSATKDVFLSVGGDVNKPSADGTTPLHRAVLENDLKSVQALIAAGANVKVANNYNVTPLWLAANNGNAAMIEALMKAGADPNAVASEGETALMTAARTGTPDAVKALIAHGANVNAKESWYGQTALMWAAIENNAVAARLLIEAGADLNAKTNSPPPGGRGGGGDGSRGGFTPLMFAARQGSMEAGAALLAAGADPNLSDPDGINPLTVALLSGHYDFTGLLIDKGADVTKGDRTGRTPLYVAVDMHSLEWRFNRPAPKKFEKQYGSMEIVKKLLDRGADVNAELNAGILGPSRAATGNRNLTKGSTPFLKACTTSDVEMMKLLLDWGADPFQTNATHANCLMMVAGLNWQPQASFGPQDDAIEAAKLVLELGIDVNARNDAGQTALHGAAARTEERDANKLIQFLVDRGANPWAKTGTPPAAGGGPAPAAAAQGGGGGRGNAPPGQTPLDVARGGLGDVDAMGNPSTRPANHRTMALLEELMKTHPDPSKASAQ